MIFKVDTGEALTMPIFTPENVLDILNAPMAPEEIGRVTEGDLCIITDALTRQYAYSCGSLPGRINYHTYQNFTITNEPNQQLRANLKAIYTALRGSDRTNELIIDSQTCGRGHERVMDAYHTVSTLLSAPSVVTSLSQGVYSCLTLVMAVSHLIPVVDPSPSLEGTLQLVREYQILNQRMKEFARTFPPKETVIGILQNLQIIYDRIIVSTKYAALPQFIRYSIDPFLVPADVRDDELPDEAASEVKEVLLAAASKLKEAQETLQREYQAKCHRLRRRHWMISFWEAHNGKIPEMRTPATDRFASASTPPPIAVGGGGGGGAAAASGAASAAGAGGSSSLRR